MQKQTLRDVDVAGKRVLVRVDFNIPFYPGTTIISDDSRLRSSIPTIKYLSERGAKVILCSHLGRPGGKVVEELRLAPVSQRLSQHLGSPVAHVEDCVGPVAEKAVASLRSGDILLLENVRFHPGDEKNDPLFSRALASLAELYVNDAFAAAHRGHASIVGITKFLPALAGFLMERELEMLGQVLHSPLRPMAAVIGGIKVTDKIAVIENLMRKVDLLLIGGGMVATFLKAKGISAGQTEVEQREVDIARNLMKMAGDNHISPRLPVDVVIGDSFSASTNHTVFKVDNMPESGYIMDIGPETAEAYSSELKRCNTVVWNGPMGVFEYPVFSRGTKEIATTLASMISATTLVGGGSTAEAVLALGLNDHMTHVSTGGGASLEYLEGKVLPGVAALLDKKVSTAQV
jgi:phosphoglycerate kinase